MDKTFTSKNQKDWDEYLPYHLSAYQEAAQESTGFASFELLYGWHVRGPLEALRYLVKKLKSQQWLKDCHKYQNKGNGV